MTDSAKVIAILKNIIAAIEENAQFLTDLDAAIGDNDHGINMARGFKKVDADLPGLAGKDIGAILKKVGMDLVPAQEALYIFQKRLNSCVRHFDAHL